MTVEELKLEIGKLSEDERSTIFYYLVDMTGGTEPDNVTDEEIEQAWLDECKRRIAEIERGEVTCASSEEMFAHARAVSS